MPSSEYEPHDGREDSRIVEAVTRVLRSAQSQRAAKQIQVPSWLIDLYVAERRAVVGSIGVERAHATDEFIQGVRGAAMQFADAHGHTALALLTSRRQERLSELKEEYQSAVQREVERDVLPFIARIADDNGGEVVMLDIRLVENSRFPPVRIIQRFDFDEERPDETLSVVGLVVAARTSEIAEWEGYYPGNPLRGPVRVSDWVRARLLSDPAFDPDEWANDDLVSSLGQFTVRAKEHRESLAKELDAVEVETAITADVLDGLLSFSPSAATRPTALEVDTLRMRHRRALLVTSKPFFLAAVSELRKSGRATSVNAAFELLKQECTDDSGEEVHLAYSSAKSTDNALNGLGASSVELDEHGYEALIGPKGLKDHERDAIDSVRDLLQILG